MINLDLVAMLKVCECHFEAMLCNPAPRAGKIRPDINGEALDRGGHG